MEEKNQEAVTRSDLEIAIRDLRQELTFSIAACLEQAKVYAAAAIEPVRKDSAEALSILKVQEIREEAKEAAERALAAKIAADDARVDYLLNQRKSASDITGKHTALANEQDDRKHKRSFDWLTLLVSSILSLVAGAGGFQAIRAWFK